MFTTLPQTLRLIKHWLHINLYAPVDIMSCSACYYLCYFWTDFFHAMLCWHGISHCHVSFRPSVSPPACPPMLMRLLLQLSGTGMKWRLNYHMGKRVLDMLKTVDVVLGGAVEQTVAVVETRTDYTHCNRFGRIECQTWPDVA